MVLIVEIGDHKIRNAVSVYIPRIDAHASFRGAIRVVGDLSVESYVLESAVFFVDEKQIR